MPGLPQTEEALRAEIELLRKRTDTGVGFCRIKFREQDGV